VTQKKKNDKMEIFAQVEKLIYLCTLQDLRMRLEKEIEYLHEQIYLVKIKLNVGEIFRLQ